MNNTNLNEPTDHPAGTIALLAASVGSLSDEVSGLRTAAVHLAGRTRRNEWAVSLTILGLVLDLLLSVFFLYQNYEVRVTQQRADAVLHGLCFYNDLFLGLESPTARSHYQGGPAAYDKAYLGLHGIAKNLNCTVK